MILDKRVRELIYITILVIVLTVILITRLFALKKELKKMRMQLKNYNERKTNKKMDMALLDKDIESLGLEINNLIDLYVAENRRRILFEEEQKQVIANMSHDLRTPLTSILGYIQMAQEDDITSEDREELLRVAKERAMRLEILLKDFFDLSIMESIDHHLKAEKINLKSITIDILMSFYDRFQEKNMEPTIHMPENDVFIISDDSAVTRVIENLISNAITHSDGNVVISFEEERSLARLIVKNDANTLTKQDVERMFDRFYMADQSRSGKSTGLGLSIVKSFMEKMDGKITAQLKDGQLSIICEWEVVGE